MNDPGTPKARDFPLIPWDNSRRSGTGRCANTDPLLDRYNLESEGNGPMHIVPTGNSTAAPPPSPEARLDGCPECVLNAELPRSIEPTPDGFLAAYLCTDCGHAWATAWKDD